MVQGEFDALQPGMQVLLISAEEMGEYAKKAVYKDLFGTVVTVKSKDLSSNRIYVEEVEFDADGERVYFYNTEIVESYGFPSPFEIPDSIDELFW